MRMNHAFPALLLGAALAFTPALALAQDTTGQTAKQDMKDAGHETKNAAKDTGHGIKNGTKHGYNKTKHGTKKAWHKTKNTTEGAVEGGREGAHEPANPR